MQQIIDSVFTDPITRRFASNVVKDIANISNSPLSLSKDIDIVTAPDTYIVFADLPGVLKSNLQVDITKNGHCLYIRADRKNTLTANSTRRTTFSYEVALPEDVEKNTIDAKLIDGVLQVTLKRVLSPDWDANMQRIQVN